MATVLLVDDDADVLDVLCSALAPVHGVERAASGLAALEILEKGVPIDLLLTDIKMPGIHGFALARMARMRHPDLKVVYISGYSHEIDDDHGARFGPMLQKPVSITALLHAIDAALSGPPKTIPH